MLFFMLSYQMHVNFGGTMKTYSKKLVYDYLDGKVILEYDLEELEDDINFMMMAIDYSNDKNMYNVCGDNLKKNFVFIKYLINKFHNNVEFVLEVCQDYFKVATESESLELKIILCDYYKKIMIDEIIGYEILLNDFYLRERLTCELCKKKTISLEDKDFLGLGFSLILDEYGNNEVIKEYVAKKMLNEIFDFSELEFEVKLHKKFKSGQDLEKMGINNFIINYIREYDGFLAGYMVANIDLLSDIRKKIIKLISRWAKYELAKDRELIEIILEEVDKFCNDNLFFTGYELVIFNYIMEKFKLRDKFLRCNIDLAYYDYSFNGEVDDIKKLDINEFKLEYYGLFIKFMERIEKICHDGMAPDNYLEDVVKPKKKKGKILKLDAKNSNN